MVRPRSTPTPHPHPHPAPRSIPLFHPFDALLRLLPASSRPEIKKVTVTHEATNTPHAVSPQPLATSFPIHLSCLSPTCLGLPRRAAAAAAPLSPPHPDPDPIGDRTPSSVFIHRSSRGPNWPGHRPPQDFPLHSRPSLGQGAARLLCSCRPLLGNEGSKSGMFVCDPSTQLTTSLTTTSTLTTLEPSEHVEILNGGPAILQRIPSGAEHIASNARVTQDKNQQRRSRDKARRDRLTLEQREKMNAHRRATRLNKTNEERNASQRVARQNLSSKERHEMNARRREASKNKPAEQRQETNARRRARRQSIPPEERQALRAKRNADLFARRKTPCAESIAMSCPDNQRDWCTGSNGDLPFVIHNKARYLGHCYLLLEVGMNHERGSSELKKTSMCGCLIMGNIPC